MAFEHATAGTCACVAPATLVWPPAGDYRYSVVCANRHGVRPHSYGIVHRDLKSLNIVLHEGAGFATWDIAVPLGEHHVHAILLRHTACTPGWSRRSRTRRKRTCSACSWPRTRRAATFLANSILEMSHIISRGEYPLLPSHYSVELAELIEQMLQKDQRRRPSGRGHCFAWLLTMRKVRQKRQQQGHRPRTPQLCRSSPSSNKPHRAAPKERAQRSRCCAIAPGCYTPYKPYIRQPAGRTLPLPRHRLKSRRAHSCCRPTAGFRVERS